MCSLLWVQLYSNNATVLCVLLKHRMLVYIQWLGVQAVHSCATSYGVCSALWRFACATAVGHGPWCWGSCSNWVHCMLIIVWVHLLSPHVVQELSGVELRLLAALLAAGGLKPRSAAVHICRACCIFVTNSCTHTLEHRFLHGNLASIAKGTEGNMPVGTCIGQQYT